MQAAAQKRHSAYSWTMPEPQTCVSTSVEGESLRSCVTPPENMLPPSSSRPALACLRSFSVRRYRAAVPWLLAVFPLLSSLRELRLWDRHGPSTESLLTERDDGWLTLQHFEPLRFLEVLHVSAVTWYGVEVEAFWLAHPHLRDLGLRAQGLSVYPLPLPHAVLTGRSAVSGVLPHLERLELEECDINLQHLIAVVPNLQHLALRFCDVWGFQHLQGKGVFKSLKSLHLRDIHYSLAEPVEFICCLKTLRDLVFVYNRSHILQEEITTALPNICRLELGCDAVPMNEWFDEDVVQESQGRDWLLAMEYSAMNHTLELPQPEEQKQQHPQQHQPKKKRMTAMELTMGGSGEDPGYGFAGYALAGRPHCHELRSLSLTNTTLVTLAQLAQLKPLIQLEDLRLGGYPMGMGQGLRDEGLALITRQHPFLRSLVLGATPALTPAAIPSLTRLAQLRFLCLSIDYLRKPASRVDFFAERYAKPTVSWASFLCLSNVLRPDLFLLPAEHEQWSKPRRGWSLGRLTEMLEHWDPRLMPYELP